MAAEVEQVVDNPVATPEGDAAARAAEAAAPADKVDKAVAAGKFKTVEEAEQAYAELHKKLGHQGNELGDARRQLENLREQAQVAAQLAKIEANTRQPAKGDDRDAQFNAFVHNYAEKYGMNEDAVRELLGTSAGWLSQESRSLREELQRERDAIRKEMAALQEATALLEADPAERAEIKRMQAEYGLPPAKAKALAAEMRQLRVSAEAGSDRIQPPGAAGNGRVTRPAKDEKPDYSEAEIAAYRARYPELTDEDFRTLEAERKAARAQQAKMAKGVL